MRYALCNEVLRERSFADQCAFAAALGYDALEVAPFTLSDRPHELPAAERTRLRREAEAAGMAVSGLHFVLIAPPGLTLNGPDAEARTFTKRVLGELVQLCADLGGRYLVHGSPQQRSVPDGASFADARERAKDTLAAVAEAAQAAGVTHCLEPLAPRETNFVNTVAEAAELVREVGSPALKTMLDTCAASQAESEPVEAVLRRWMPTGLLAHVQVNDTNRRGPGQGELRFAPILQALADTGYDGTLAVEPFDYHPDPGACAARAIGYLKGLEEARSA
jgi:sugar phosphate isomerase/epimerase